MRRSTTWSSSDDAVASLKLFEGGDRLGHDDDAVEDLVVREWDLVGVDDEVVAAQFRTEGVLDS